MWIINIEGSYKDTLKTALLPEIDDLYTEEILPCERLIFTFLQEFRFPYHQLETGMSLIHYAIENSIAPPYQRKQVKKAEEYFRVFESKQEGLPYLDWSDILYKTAKEHAEDLGVKSLMGHIGSDKSSPEFRVIAQSYWTKVGIKRVFECYYNLHYNMGEAEVQRMMGDMFIGITEHQRSTREALLNPRYTRGAVACHKNNGMPWSAWAVILLVDFELLSDSKLSLPLPIKTEPLSQKGKRTELPILQSYAPPFPFSTDFGVLSAQLFNMINFARTSPGKIIQALEEKTLLIVDRTEKNHLKSRIKQIGRKNLLPPFLWSDNLAKVAGVFAQFLGEKGLFDLKDEQEEKVMSLPELMVEIGEFPLEVAKTVYACTYFDFESPQSLIMEHIGDESMNIVINREISCVGVAIRHHLYSTNIVVIVGIQDTEEVLVREYGQPPIWNQIQVYYPPYYGRPKKYQFLGEHIYKWVNLSRVNPLYVADYLEQFKLVANPKSRKESPLNAMYRKSIEILRRKTPVAPLFYGSGIEEACLGYLTDYECHIRQQLLINGVPKSVNIITGLIERVADPEDVVFTRLLPRFDVLGEQWVSFGIGIRGLLDGLPAISFCSTDSIFMINSKLKTKKPFQYLIQIT